jgi:hypothetical protein
MTGKWTVQWCVEIHRAKINPKSSLKNYSAKNTRWHKLHEQIWCVCVYIYIYTHILLKVLAVHGWCCIGTMSISAVLLNSSSCYSFFCLTVLSDMHAPYSFLMWTSECCIATLWFCNLQSVCCAGTLFMSCVLSEHIMLYWCGVTYSYIFFLLLLGSISINAPVCTAAFKAYCGTLNTIFSPDSTALCLL